MRKNIITTPASKVKGATLFVVDYTEVGVDKTVDVTHVAIEKVVDGAQATICGAAIFGGATKQVWKNHRNNMADRLLERGIRREERKAMKFIASRNDSKQEQEISVKAAAK